MSDFVWYDLNTKDLSAAREFYGKLLGWNVQPWTPEGAPEGTPAYNMLMIGEGAFGGMNELPGDVPFPSHWHAHVTVPDVDAAYVKGQKMGATFPMEPMDVPTVGRMVPMIDPFGAVISLFTPVSEMTNFVPSTTPGMVGWNELMVEDVQAAKGFYGELLGWEFADSTMPGMEYTLIGTETVHKGGIMQRPETVPANCWILYFTVEDIAASTAKAKELGAIIPTEMIDVPGVGKLQPITAPDGSVCCIAQWYPRS
ncbi:MAG: VOC family protein [Myxococcales bacterium]|nr:VOC family protein [Myxococcales bacterium]